MQADPQRVGRRGQQLGRDPVGEDRQRGPVGRDEVPPMVDDHGGEGLVPGEDGVEGGAHRRHRAGLERRLGVDRRVPGREQQAVAVPQRHVEVLGQVDDELAARARPAGLDEAQVAGGDLRLERPAPAGSAAGAAASPATGHRRRGEATPRSCRRRYRRTVVAAVTSQVMRARQRAALSWRGRGLRCSTAAQVRLAARREAIADLEADRQPEVLQLADVELERLRLAPEGRREIRRPDGGTRRDRVEDGERPRSVAAGTIESRQPLVERRATSSSPSTSDAASTSPRIRLVERVEADAVRRGGPRCRAARLPLPRARRVAGRADVPCAEARGIDDVDRVDEQATDRGAVHPSGHDLSSASIGETSP